MSSVCTFESPADNVVLVLDVNDKEGEVLSRPHRTSIEIEGIYGQYPNVLVKGRLLQSQDPFTRSDLVLGHAIARNRADENDVEEKKDNRQTRTRLAS
jgi:hypothetical protein